MENVIFGFTDAEKEFIARNIDIMSNIELAKQLECGQGKLTKFLYKQKNEIRRKEVKVPIAPVTKLLSHSIKPIKESDKALRHRLRHVWHSMIRRCYKESGVNFKHYGGRGITVCEKWRASFDEFFNWAIQNNPQSHLELDRRNNNGNYTPDNCRFADWETQANNRRTSRLVTAFDITKSVAQWSRDSRCVVNYSILLKRILSGWDSEKAITTHKDD